MNKTINFFVAIALVLATVGANSASLSKASQSEDASTLYRQGLAYNNRNMSYWDPVKARALFKKAALQGHARAQNSLGTMYEQGIGGVKSQTEAENWYLKAGEQNLTNAEFNLGLFYAKANKIQKSISWYKKAAEKGLARAQINLAFMYSQVKNAKESARWTEKAALQGNETAQLYLGMLYASGDGVAKSSKKSESWYLKAAAQGNVTAQVNLSIMYIGSKHYKEAIKWAQKAAVQGENNAQYNLAYLYSGGKGIKRDHEKAYLWFSLAKRNGYNVSQINQALKYTKSKLSPTKVNAIKKLTDVCFKSHYKQCD